MFKWLFKKRKKTSMSAAEIYYKQEEQETEMAIKTMKNMKNIDLKEKYKKYLETDPITVYNAGTQTEETYFANGDVLYRKE